jgi:hypothetical protein
LAAARLCECPSMESKFCRLRHSLLNKAVLTGNLRAESTVIRYGYF